MEYVNLEELPVYRDLIAKQTKEGIDAKYRIIKREAVCLVCWPD